MGSQPPITRIFLDTNVLHQAWPMFSVKVENMCAEATKLGLAIHIPDAVLQELENNWRERIGEELEKARASLKMLGSTIGDDGLGGPLPDWPRLTAAHDSAVQATLKKWSISITPFTTATTNTLFSLAITKGLVFGPKGVNFQDAVILHSCIDNLVGTKEVGGIVSEDGIFHSRSDSWQAYAKDRNVSLRPLRLADLLTHLLQRLTETDRLSIERQRALALKTIEAYLPVFEETFNESINGNPLTELRDFRAISVKDVDVTQVPSDAPAGAKVRMSAIVRGTVVEEERHQPNPNVASYVVTSTRQDMEIGFTATATYQKDRYDIEGVSSITFGMPGHFGTVAHPKLNP